ncbi:hypothetical protein ACNVED_08710 [Legionella sp. D16C41]|uniref:hypothetical protein n=1 Tax=Legionella sp. D16C41 TaxID=3402688 RepID=UPI003AF9199B
MYAKSINSLAKSSNFFQQAKVDQSNQHLPARTADEIKKMANLLNSERIMLIFGHYNVELILQENSIRVSNLNSNGVMRTCAIVNFSLSIPDWLQNTHNKIYQGESIGKTIKNGGFNLNKEDIYFGLAKLPKFVKDKMETNDASAAIHLYQLIVENPKNGESIAYCTITEVHSPLYLTLEDLHQLSPKGFQKYNILTNSVQKYLDEFISLDKWVGQSSSNITLA